MTFVTPALAIAGLIAVAVPIIIHLLARRRRRPIEWAAMRFLIEAFQKHRRRLRIEQLLLLIVRCLVLALLGAALARPLLDAPEALDLGGSRAVFLVVDNGLASSVVISDGRTALDNTIDQAVTIVQSLGPGDTVGVVTAARPARGLVVPPSSDHAAIIELLRSMQPAEAPTDFASAAVILRAALKEMPADRDRAVAYLLSEFRSGSAALDVSLPAALSDLGEAVILVTSPVGQEPVANVQVVAIEPLRGLILTSAAEGSVQVTVRLARTGGDLASDVTRVRLVGDGLPLVEPKVVQWVAGQSWAAVDFMLNFAGQRERTVTLTAVLDHDALTADDQRHTVVSTRNQIRVLLVDRRSFGPGPGIERLRAGQWIRRALQPAEQSPVDVVEADPAALDAQDVRGVDAVIVPRPDLLNDDGWSVLSTFVDGGGVLVVSPPAQVNVHQWTDRLSADLRLPWRIALEVVDHETSMGLADEQPSSELLRMLSGDLAQLLGPVLVNRVLPIDRDSTRAQDVLVFSDGTPMIIAGTPRPRGSDDAGASGPVSIGTVIYVAVALDLDWTNLPTKPLMVPLFHELLRQAVGSVRAAPRYSVGEQPTIALGATAATLVGPEGATLSIGEDGRLRQPLKRAGLYHVLDTAAQRLGTIAVNIDPASSRTDTQPQSAVSDWLAKLGPWEVFDADDPAAALRSIESGSPIVGLLLIAVLVLIVLETAAARWFSHASVSGQPPAIASPVLHAPSGAIAAARGSIR